MNRKKKCLILFTVLFLPIILTFERNLAVIFKTRYNTLNLVLVKVIIMSIRKKKLGKTTSIKSNA